MKSLLLLCITLLSSGQVLGFVPRDTLTMLEAKNKGKLTFIARGAYNPEKIQPELPSSHYGECVDMRIKNTSNSPLAIKLEAGTVLLSQVSHTQNMLVTKTTYYSLEPDEKFFGRIYAMCGELKKNTPDIYVNYDIGSLASPNLCKLAKYIDIYQEQNLAGQYAMWAVTDKATVKELGENYAVLKQSQDILNRVGIKFNMFAPNGETKKGNTTVQINARNTSTPTNVLDTLVSDVIAQETKQGEQNLNEVLKEHSEKGIKIGETAWWKQEDSIWLFVALGVLVIFAMIFFYLNRK